MLLFKLYSEVVKSYVVEKFNPGRRGLGWKAERCSWATQKRSEVSRIVPLCLLFSCYLYEHRYSVRGSKSI